MAVSFYPWFAVPMIAGTDIFKLMKNVVPLGLGPFFFVDGFRNYSVPVLVSIPAALMVVCVLLFRFLTLDKKTSSQPFDGTGGAL